MEPVLVNVPASTRIDPAPPSVAELINVPKSVSVTPAASVLLPVSAQSAPASTAIVPKCWNSVCNAAEIVPAPVAEPSSSVLVAPLPVLPATTPTSLYPASSTSRLATVPWNDTATVAPTVPPPMIVPESITVPPFPSLTPDEIDPAIVPELNTVPAAFRNSTPTPPWIRPPMLVTLPVAPKYTPI